MNDKELFYGFDSAQKYIEHLIDTNGSVMKKQIDQYREHFKKFNKDDWSSMASESDAIYKALAKAIEEEAIVDSEEVQNIMNRYFQYSKRLMKELVSKDNLKNVAEKYDNPSMKKVLGTYHPRMFEFFLRALQFYANKNLQ